MREKSLISFGGGNFTVFIVQRVHKDTHSRSQSLRFFLVGHVLKVKERGALVTRMKGISLTLSLPESNLESINVVVIFESVDKTLVCDHSNESY